MPAEPMVYIVDDDEDVRASLTWLLDSAGLPVRSFASAEDFLATESAERTGCVVLDLRMPGMDGTALFERLSAQRSPLPVIFLTGHGDVPTAVRLIKRGAFDFLEKPFAEGEIVERVRQALAHSRARMAREIEATELRMRMARLTQREREVLERVIGGQANKVIAAELAISEKTVEIHRANVMRKMEAKTLAELIKMTSAIRVDQGNPL